MDGNTYELHSIFFFNKLYIVILDKSYIVILDKEEKLMTNHVVKKGFEVWSLKLSHHRELIWGENCDLLKQKYLSKSYD